MFSACLGINTSAILRSERLGLRTSHRETLVNTVSDLSNYQYIKCAFDPKSTNFGSLLLKRLTLKVLLMIAINPKKSSVERDISMIFPCAAGIAEVLLIVVYQEKYLHFV